MNDKEKIRELYERRNVYVDVAEKVGKGVDLTIIDDNSRIVSTKLHADEVRIGGEIIDVDECVGFPLDYHINAIILSDVDEKGVDLHVSVMFSYTSVDGGVRVYEDID